MNPSHSVVPFAKKTSAIFGVQIVLASSPHNPDQSGLIRPSDLRAGNASMINEVSEFG
jgi:hypothetical protein